MAFILTLSFAACSEAIIVEKGSDEVQSESVSTEDTLEEQSEGTFVDNSSNADSYPDESSSYEQSEPSQEGSSQNDSSSDETTEETSVEPLYSKLELIASLKVGEDIDISVMDVGFSRGVQSYFVDDKEEVYVVSDYEYKIIRMSDKKSVFLEKGVNPHGCAVMNDLVYVFDTENMVNVYDINKGFIEKYKLPGSLASFDISTFYIQNNELYFNTFYNQKFMLKNGRFVEVEINDKINYTENMFTLYKDKITVSVGIGKRTAHYLGSDETGFYLYEGDVSESNIERALRKYDYKGNMIEYITFDYSDCITYPAIAVMYTNGNIYLMKCTEKTVDAYRVTLGNIDIS